MNKIQKLVARFLIPKGFYCNGCPFHSINHTKPEHENGYCSYLGKGDWDINSEHADDDVEVTTFTKGKAYTEIVKGRDLPPNSLLWDNCKECGIKV